MTILWIPRLETADFHHLAFSRTETQSFTGKAEANTNSSELATFYLEINKIYFIYF